jgi:hypothetical protein
MAMPKTASTAIIARWLVIWGTPPGRPYSDERADWIRKQIQDHMVTQNVRPRRGDYWHPTPLPSRSRSYGSGPVTRTGPSTYFGPLPPLPRQS